MFESFSLFIETNELDIDSNIKITIENHLQSLYDTFEHYYPVNQDPRDGYLWVQNPFLINSQHKLCLKEQELLLEISSDIGLQSKFKTMSPNFGLNSRTSITCFLKKQ